MLKFIKITHTLIWAVMVAAILYIVYCGLTDRVNLLLWLSITLIFIEGLVLLLNKWNCPITAIARKYTDDQKDNFDIYLPNSLAKYTKTIFSILFIIGLILLIF